MPEVTFSLHAVPPGPLPAEVAAMPHSIHIPHVPLSVAASSLPVLGGLLLGGTGAIVAVAAPGGADMASLFGTAMACVIVLVESRKKDRDVGNIASALAGSFSGGLIGPGVLITFFQWKEWTTAQFTSDLSWHSYAFLGLVFGLMGWSFALTMYSIFTDKLPGWLRRKFDPDK